MPTPQFACPSPRGSNNAGLYLTKAGHLVDRHGRSWGRSSMKKMAQDAAMPDTSRPTKPQNPQATTARVDIGSALQKFCAAHGLDPEKVRAEVDDLLNEHERRAIQSYAQSLGSGTGGVGKGARDDDRGAAACDRDGDDDASVEQRVREFLASKGLDDEEVEEALKRVRADREEARDSRPQPATRGGFGGRFSGATKDDVESEYGGGHLLDLPDYSPDPDRFGSGYDPLKRRDPARNLPGGGISRRLSNDAALASDADLAKEYPGIENVIVGY
jgi:Pex14 N-terminal domain